MKNPVLSAKLRNYQQKPPQVRNTGFIPGTVYGPKITPLSIQIEQPAVDFLMKNVQKTQLIDLAIQDTQQTIKVLLQHVHKHPVTDQLLNLEFYAVDLKTKVTVEIPIHLLGEAPGVKIEKGILFQNLNALKVECLPTDILSKIEIDVSVLDNFEKAIFVKDLQIPATIKLLQHGQELVVKVLPPKKEEEEMAAPETAAAPEVIGQEKDKEKSAEDSTPLAKES